jgi:hypothetical protein
VVVVVRVRVRVRVSLTLAFMQMLVRIWEMDVTPPAELARDIIESKK